MDRFPRLRHCLLRNCNTPTVKTPSDTPLCHMTLIVIVIRYGRLFYYTTYITKHFERRLYPSSRMNATLFQKIITFVFLFIHRHKIKNLMPLYTHSSVNYLPFARCYIDYFILIFDQKDFEQSVFLILLYLRSELI